MCLYKHIIQTLFSVRHAPTFPGVGERLHTSSQSDHHHHHRRPFGLQTHLPPQKTPVAAHHPRYALPPLSRVLSAPVSDAGDGGEATTRNAANLASLAWHANASPTIMYHVLVRTYEHARRQLAESRTREQPGRPSSGRFRTGTLISKHPISIRVCDLEHQARTGGSACKTSIAIPDLAALKAPLPKPQQTSPAILLVRDALPIQTKPIDACY